ncbi:MAG: phosphoenolpyruvate synthase [bacterium]|nr:phosphoenolpyruvate synthase [bacterium]
MNTKLILSSSEASVFGEKAVGGKAKNMAWLSRNELPVPEWFVVTTEAFAVQIKEEAKWIYDQLGSFNKDSQEIGPISEKIRERIKSLPLNAEIKKDLAKQLESIPGWENTFFAVRSSAVGEDAAEASFAGQMDSFLFQKGMETIGKSVLACFASAFTDRAIRYRLNLGMDLLEIKAAVIVQKMIDSEIAGVFFTANPVTGSRQHGLISACYGSGEGIVSGICNTDEYTVEINGDGVESIINEKDRQLVFDKESGSGTIEIDIPKDLQNVSCLKDEEVKEITKLGKTISEKLQFPQDIEWAVFEGKVYILQTRPVTSLPAPKEPKGDILVWDNSNIQESYCGVTTPLTFSYASNGYAIVYEQTYRLLKVPEETLEKLMPVFRNMLGLIKGRVFYNINNWYRALLILPSFKTNKEDMERMMGLQDPVDLVEEQELTFSQKAKKIPGLLRALFTLKSAFKNIDALVAEFKAMFQREYDYVNRSRLHTLEIAELLKLHDYLTDKIMYSWQTPIFNDFYVMMMNGKVHRWLEKAGVENPVIVQNNLMSGEEGIESTEPTKFILRMCDYVRTKPELLKTIKETENEHLLGVIQVTDDEFHRQCLEYIELYGDRCMGELKLESITLRQDPTFLFAVIKNYLTREDLTIETLAANEMKFRNEAEEQAFTAIKTKLGGGKLRKFKKDLAKLRQSVKNRENMRLARTRAFGLSRDIYVEIGNQLAFHGLLEEGRDVFYLTIEELDMYMEGRSIQSQYKPLVESRKKEYASYEDEELPHHFETVGPVYHHNEYEYGNEVEINESDDVLKGIGCYPGIVEEKVKLIFSPDDELNMEGQILCTIRTDPGWAPLFPTAGGIIVERGSTLSHSAVVARELGIPAIVNVPGLTKIIKNGEKVRMDGTKGTINRLEIQNSEEKAE